MSQQRSPSARFILRGQAIGFSALIALIWAAEFLHVPHHLFGEAAQIVWLRLLARTVVLLGIWLIVHRTTSRLLQRLHELEGFLLICSWCRKVGDHGKWRTMEDYFDARFHTGTSHGICPDCSRAQLARHFSVSRVNSGDSTPQ